MKKKYFILFVLFSLLIICLLSTCEESSGSGGGGASSDYSGTWSFTFTLSTGIGLAGTESVTLSQTEIIGYYWVYGFFTLDTVNYQFSGTVDGSSLTDVTLNNLGANEWTLTGTFSDTSMSGAYAGIPGTGTFTATKP